MRFRAAAFLTLCVMASACTPAGTNGTAAPGDWGLNKTTGGTVLGAGAGGLLGSQFGRGSGNLAMTAAGTLLGGFLGNQIGASLDRADMNAAQGAEQRARSAPIGQQISWSNPQSGNSGTFTPTREGTDTSGRYCREFQQTITVAGKQEQAFGTACRQADGSWKVIQ